MAIFCQTINVNTKHTRQVHIPRYHSISVVASLGTKGPSKFNDSKIFLLYDCSNETQESCWQSEQFQFFAVIIIPMKYWNHFANNFFFSFRCCFVNSSELSQLLTALSSDEYTKQQQNDNKKMIPVFCWNDDYCKSLESFWLSALIPAFYLNDHNKKTLESLNLVGP